MKAALFNMASIIWYSYVVAQPFIRQWSEFEAEFSISGISSNAQKYALPVDAVFIGPANTQIKVPCFWDGDTVWKVRFAPPTPGEWKWAVESNGHKLSGTTSGSFLCTAVTKVDIDVNPNNRGHLKISHNKRYLIYADSTPFFWLAGTLWDGNSRNMPFETDFKSYVDNRKQKGFTAVQILIAEPHKTNPGSRNTGVNEDGRMISADLLEVTPASWRNFDKRVGYILEKGMVPIIYCGWGAMMRTYNKLYEPYYRYILARYQARNIVLCICGEYYYGTPENVRKTANYIRTVNTTAKLLTVHPGPNDANYSTMEHFSTDDWIDIQMQQVWWKDLAEYALNDYKKLGNPGPTRPLVFGEGMYDDPSNEQDRQRRPAWATILNGCCGFSYGCFGIWNWTSATGPSALNMPGAQQTAIMGKFITSIKWHLLKPGRGIICDNWCLYCPGREIVVFVPNGGTVKVKTDSLKGELAPTWLNALNGETKKVPNVNGGAELSFTSPFGNADAVLHLKKLSIDNEETKANVIQKPIGHTRKKRSIIVNIQGGKKQTRLELKQNKAYKIDGTLSKIHDVSDNFDKNYPQILIVQ